ncbi:MAG: hypothetical protein NVV63_17720 [Opitutus sp.]|nr:hypothetical protein [Opitutus sp.]
MNARVAIPLLTIAVFGAGYFAGWWIGRTGCKVPPPPPSLLGELSPSGDENATTPRPAPTPSPNFSYLASQIERLRPQIEEFRKRMDEIDREMDRRIDRILQPEQKEAFQELVRNGELYRAREDAERASSVPLTAEEVRELQRRPLQRLLTIIVVPMRLHWNTKQLKLDETQREQLREILEWRREQFIALVDQSPPPSLELSTLAPLAGRLVEPEKK